MRELIVDFYVEGGHSCSIQSYLIEKNGKVEEPLDDVPRLGVRRQIDPPGATYNQYLTALYRS